MANNYEQIMALVNAGNKMGLSNTITRDNGIPLDLSSVYSSFDDAVIYAATKATAYHGQPVAVITETDAVLYVITPVSQGTKLINDILYNIYLKQVGSQTLSDEKSICINENGALSLYGFDAAGGDTLPCKNKTTGLLEWVAIDRVVNGDGNTKAVVEAIGGSAITVTPRYDVTTDTYTYTLDVAIPAVPEYSVAKTVGQGIITYAVTKDGTPVGEAIVVPNAYDDTDLASRITDATSTLGNHTARIESIEAFFRGAAKDEGEGAALVNALDTLKEIQDYINSDGIVAEAVVRNTNAIALLTADATTEGSIAYAIAEQAKADARVFATQADLAQVSAIAENAAVKSEVNNALAVKIESASITHTSDGTVEGVTAEGTALKIVIDAFTKEETLSKIQEKIVEVNGGATAGTVASDLSSYKETTNAKLEALIGADVKLSENIEINAKALAKLNDDADTVGSIRYIIANAIAKIPAIEIATSTTAGLVKSSDEVMVTKDGSMSIGCVSTDKLVQGSDELVLLGGSATGW